MRKISAKVNPTPRPTSGFMGQAKEVLKGGWNTLRGKNIDDAKALRERNLNRARKVVLESANRGADDATIVKKWDRVDSIRDKLDGKVKREQALHNAANIGVAGAAGYGIYSGTASSYEDKMPNNEQNKTASEEQMNYSSDPTMNPNVNSYSNTQDYYDYQELAAAETKNMPDRMNLPIYDSVLKTARALDLDKDTVNYMLNTISGVNVKTAAKTAIPVISIHPAKRILGAAILAGAAGLGAHAAIRSNMSVNDVINLNHSAETVPDSYDIIPYYRY